MFVLKSGAGFSIFKWLAFLASDFLAQALSGATFFFDADIVQNKHWFFVNTVRQTLCVTSSDAQCDVVSALVHHLLHRLRADDVLPRRHAVAHQEFVRINPHGKLVMF